MARVLLLRTAGTNCDQELAQAFRLVGAEVEALHINALLKEPARLESFQVLGFPGGFSYGDDIASGKILANQLIHHLKGALRKFVDEGKLVIGICNGFQVLVKSGLLPGPMGQLAEGDWHPTTLTYNTQGRFEDRWVKLKCVSKKCAWLPADGGIFDFPVAHGEGRFVTRDASVMGALRENDQVAFEYVNEDGSRATEFPALPNGSQEAVAGICDVTGRVLGLMPHPERAVSAEHHPLFTRGGGKADGMKVFEAAAKYLKEREAVAV
jgi:phosphoribosylformylglycinamidine synthase subunit PurQ / glutaminase